MSDVSATEPTCECGAIPLAMLAAQGIEAHVTHVAPLVPSVWTQALTCPHGVTWYSEPTSEQRSAWAEDGVA